MPDMEKKKQQGDFMSRREMNYAKKANPLPEGFSVAPGTSVDLADMLTLPLLHPPPKTTVSFL
jgi:hypothetical protein